MTKRYKIKIFCKNILFNSVLIELELLTIKSIEYYKIIKMLSSKSYPDGSQLIRVASTSLLIFI